MSNDYALFIIIVPNDIDTENSIVPATATTNVTKLESNSVRRPSIGTVSALVAPGAIPLVISPTIPKLNEINNEHEQSCPISVCILLRNYLAERSDIEAVWMISENKKLFQVTFYVEFGFASDRMLQDLSKLSIGNTHGTKVFVLPTTVVLTSHNNLKSGSLSSLDSIENMHDIVDNKLSPINETDNLNNSSRKIRKRFQESDFKKSVRARLMVHQVVASIQASSAITFDFVLLICLASMLAAFGLLENSTVIIVASMLVSPLMNPILGIVFGLSVRDQSLWRRGLQNEMIGLIICISCGFILGLFTTYFETKWGSSTSFPTSEMRSRGDVKRLWVGVLIALPSGAGVALSVLGGNTGSLVGVAISASLLPPAVNCGLLFAYAFLGRIFSNIGATQYPTSINTIKDFNSSNTCGKYINNDYLPLYTCKLANEAAILACCSLLLTIVNIICIILMALIIFRIKEVAPLHQPNKDIANFFRYDVKVARDYNKTINENDFDQNNLAQTIVNRWKTFKSSTSNENQQQQSSSTDTDVESMNQKNNLFPDDIESRRKVFRLKTFAKEYDLDIFNTDDYNLTNRDSQEKVRLLVSDLIDMYQEIPAIFIDLYRLQPLGTHTSTTDKEHMSFYQEIIEVLPQKWYQLFVYERQRRLIKSSLPLTFNRSHSMRLSAFESNDENLRPSLTEHNKKDRCHLSRQRSVPESTRHKTIIIHEENEIPVEGTRFRITKPNTESTGIHEDGATRI